MLIKCSVYVGGVFITLYLIYSLFELEKSLFFVESAAVSHQSAVAAYHPVTGDYYRYRIGSVCRSDGTHCLGIAYP